MLIANLVEDVFLSSKIKGSWNLYLLKKSSKAVILLATFYDEWHAIWVRRSIRVMYGLPVNEVSKRDVMYGGVREKYILERVHQLNLKSHNKIVRAHEATRNLAEDILSKLAKEQPEEWAQRLLSEMDKRRTA